MSTVLASRRHRVSTTPWWLTAACFMLVAMPLPASISAQGDERSILVEFFTATSGTQWLKNENWGTDAPICSWHGVSCIGGSKTGDNEVDTIQLTENNIAGEIPPSLYSLPLLRFLDLEGNPVTNAGFEGFQQAEETQGVSVSPLETLALNGCNLQNIAGIGHAPDTLRDLRLADNKLKGDFPVELFQVTSLRRLFLDQNGITGTIPTTVGTMDNLIDFHAINVPFQGQIPSEFGKLTKLVTMVLRDNNFKGTIPNELNNMLNLEILSIGRSPEAGQGELSGALPSFSQLYFMELLDFSLNKLNGTIPRDFFLNNQRTDDLVIVRLDGNELTGTIPKQLGWIDSMDLGLTGNKLVGPIPQEICEKKQWMTGLVEQFGCDAIVCPAGSYSQEGRQTQTEECSQCDGDASLYLGQTSCSGGSSSNGAQPWKVLPELYLALQGQSWDNADGWSKIDGLLKNKNKEDLTASDLDVCSFYGVTCTSSGDIEKIELSDNSLYGVIPSSVFTLPTMTTFDASSNKVSMDKEAFQKIADTSALTKLVLSHTDVNSLAGIAGAASLAFLFLDGITMESVLPDDLFTLTNLIELEISNSQVRGTIPSSIGRLNKLQRIELHWNALSGAVPTQVGLLSVLEELDFSYNNFDGTLPTELFSLSSLKKLELSRAQRGGLSGDLPAFDALPALEDLGLSSNDFKGTIPTSFLSGVSDKTKPIKVNLGYNRLEGIVPHHLDVFSTMVLNLEGNLISDLPSMFCDNTFWMEGFVGEATFGCNAILCPPGTWNKNGKETKSSLCLPCDESADVFGATQCGNTESDAPPAAPTPPGSTPAPAPQQPKTETEILDMLFAATNGQDWKEKHDGWLVQDTPACDREGIACNDEGKVESLRLNRFGLNGQIPTEIFQLQSNRVLGFTDNNVDLRFEGIEQSVALETLLMSNTKLKSLDGLQHATPTLKALHLARNDLDGSFPKSLLQLGGLHKLYMNQNKLTGSIPTEIASMSTLKEIEIWDNRLTGNIPSEIGQLEMLQKFNAKGNILTGPIPIQLGQLSSLQEIDLSNQKGPDKLGGPLYDFASNPNLHLVNVSTNSFAGTVPPTMLSFVNKTRQITLDLSNNKLSGDVPTALSEFDSLDLYLANNMISSLPPGLCEKGNWMGGAVEQQSCDAILCPPGTFSSIGRANSTTTCATCNAGGSAVYFGSTSCSNVAQDSERDILTKFYIDLNGATWLSSFNWNTDNGICTWFGVTCNDDLSVVELKLASNQIISTKDQLSAVAPIFQLPNLEVLDLKGNSVYLDFQEIAFSPALQSMRVSGTGLSSLAGISRATNLHRLHATDNLLNTTIPDEIFDLTELRSLYLSFNSMKGSISSKISKLSNLQEFYMYGNLLEKGLPTEMGQLKELRELVLARNYLTGTIPIEFSSLPKLEQLSLYDQQGTDRLKGKIPNFVNSPSVWFFDASNCALTGTIPSDFMKNSIHVNATITLVMKNNQISGTIPSTLSKFDSIDMDLTGNKIESISEDLCNKKAWMKGEVEVVGGCDAILCPPGTYNENGRQKSAESPCQSCDDLKGVAYMGQLECKSFEGERGALSLLYSSTGGSAWKAKNKWTSDSPVCSWEGIECSGGKPDDDEGVTAIKLEKNNLVGSLPSSLWSLPSIKTMILSGNEDLSISFDEISNAAGTLEDLQVSNTKIETIDGIGQATSLKQIYLDENGLTGTFPSELLELHASLEKLRFSANYFYGSLPSDITKMTKMTEFHMANNEFYSTIPSEIALLTNLQSLALNENLFYGSLPTQMSTMPNLQIFSVRRERKSGPKLSGSVPKFDQNPSLTVLFLDGNEFSGTIPSDFLKSSSSVYLVDLKNNSLSGAVPESLEKLSELDVRMEGNQISTLAGAFCDNGDWMGGNVGRLKTCDAIMCSPGTANPNGRALSSPDECKSCSSPKAAPFYGSRTCEPVLTEKEILVKLYNACNGGEWKTSTNWNSNLDICDWHGVGCKDGHVILINLGSNNLSGTPPPELFDLPKLEILWLNSNPIQFSFDHISRATSLMDLRVDETSLTTLAGVGAAVYLTSLHVGFNSIGGQFPPELLKLSNIRTLSMNNCYFTGTIPDMTSMEFLRTLRLGNNKFSGTVPSFDGMHILNTLDLSSNELEGSIPEDFVVRIGIRLDPEIDLSNNKITGTVPSALARFDNLRLYLRGNKIEALPGVLCDKSNWMGGDVGKFGCDALLCAPGTSNFDGRHSSRSPGCATCPEADDFFGQAACLSATLGRSAASSLWGSIHLALGGVLLSFIVVFNVL